VECAEVAESEWGIHQCEEGAAVLEKAQKEDFVFAPVDRLGEYRAQNVWLQRHIDAVVKYPLVDVAILSGPRKF
jgi:hypothetical protein